MNDKKLGVSSNNTSVDYYNPQVASAQDYYPFGMLQPGRSINISGYRYGFNGKENDNEVKGEGEQQDYGMRVYDPRMGRFLSVDPLTKDYPWYTPYQFAGNMPIWAIDLDGLEEKKSTTNVNTVPVLSLQSSKEIVEFLQSKYKKPSLTFNLKDNGKTMSSSVITEQKKFTDNEITLIAFGSEGNVGLNQNPTLNVSETTTKETSIVEDWGKYGKFVRTITQTITTTVDISKGSLDLKISNISVTTTESISYSKILSQNSFSETVEMSLNSNDNNYSSRTYTNKIPLAGTYDENLKKISDKLAEKVNEAGKENVEISKRAIKGIYEAPKSLEKRADEGKMIQGKGKYFDSNTKP